MVSQQHLYKQGKKGPLKCNLKKQLDVLTKIGQISSATTALNYSAIVKQNAW